MANGQDDDSQQLELKLCEVHLKVVGSDLKILQECEDKLDLVCTCKGKSCEVVLYSGKDEILKAIIGDSAQIYRAGPTIVFLRLPHGSAIITTSSQADSSALLSHLESSVPSEQKWSELSVFNLRTEESSAKQYFQFYGYLSQQQNMLQDYVRTGTYQSAMHQNMADFRDKVVLDVGAGTGVLSFFALQAGASKVYAIEASNMAAHCQKLVKDNHYSKKMTVITGKVEEVEIPEMVDMIISEPMGYMLFNERMLETYLHAKKWLKPGGNMFPTKGILYIAPFTDEALYAEQFSKANFWTQNSFHGVNVTSLREEALEEYFRQPVLDTFDVRIVMAKPVGHTTDFLKADENDLIKINIPLQYKMWSTGMVHGLAFWFDCAFCGSESTVWLSTAPFQPLTHWYQIRMLLPKPMFLHKDQEMTGLLRLTANERQSYDVTIELEVTGSAIKSKTSYDLKNPNFRYMASSLSIPGTLHANPTETYYQENPPTAHETSVPPATNHAPPPPPPQLLNPTSLQVTNPRTGKSISSSQILNPPALNTYYSSSAVNPMSPQQTMNPTSPQPTVNPMSPQQQQMPSSVPLVLNPAAPQFVPIPDHHHHRRIGQGASNAGLLSAPSSGGGFYQSTAMYMMGGQQMVYSQSNPNMGSGIGQQSKYQGIMQGPYQGQPNSSPQSSRLYLSNRNHYY